MRTWVAIGALACLGASSAACEVNLNTEGLSTTDMRTFAVAGQPDVTLETFDGAIEIHSWDQPSVEVSIEKRGTDQAVLDEIVIEAEQQGDTIVLRVKGPNRGSSRSVTVGVHISPSARLLVALPRHSIIQARTGDGAIRVEDVDGRISLNTGDGSVALDRVLGEIEVRTGDGAIRMEKVAGRLDLETLDGSITLDGRPSVVRARTGDGSIRARLDRETRMTESWELSTGDGSITLTLPPDFAAELDAETQDGSVRASHPGIAEREEEPTGRRSRDREQRRILRTPIGSGGPALKVRTGDGTIRIES